MKNKRPASDSGLKASMIPPNAAHVNQSTFGDGSNGLSDMICENKIGKLLTIDDVAAKLQVKKKTIYNWIYQNKIKSIKLNGRLLRFTEAEIDCWILAQKEQSNVS